MEYENRNESDIKELKHLLRTTPLDARFEDYGDFVYNVSEEYVFAASMLGNRRPVQKLMPCRPYVALSGNFLTYSHAFRFAFYDRQDPLFLELVDLIKRNKERPDYKEQKAA